MDQRRQRIERRLAVYSSEATTLPDLREELPPAVAIDRADTPDGFGELLAPARVGVFRIPHLRDADVDRLNAFQDRWPLTPILVVLDLKSENVSRSRELRHGIHTVWNDNLSELPGLVRKALSTSLIEHFFVAFQALRKPSRTIFDIMRSICLDSCGLKAATKRARSYPQKMHRHWRRHVSDTVLPKEFLDRIMIVRAVEEAERRGWAGDIVDQLASALSITPQTVYALFKRRHDATPTVALDSPADILRAFEEWAAPLLHDPIPE